MGYYAAGDYYAGDGKAATHGVGKKGLLARVKGRFAKDPGLPGMKRLGKAGLKKLKGLQDPFGLGVPGGKQRRHRRMNVLNARALRTALRRAEGFTPSELNTPPIVFDAAGGDRLKFNVRNSNAASNTVDGIIWAFPL